MTSEEARLKLREKSILNINPVTPIGRRGLFPAQLFLPLIDGKEMLNEAAEPCP
jgi:hypothetical protein